MKGRNETVEDDFWTERLAFFTAQFPTYYRQPQQVHGRFHSSDERYFDGSHEIITLSHRHGDRTYVMMHPYVLDPKLTFTVGLYTKPKKFADQESPIGEVIGSNNEGYREIQVGNAQAWYYHADKTIVLWECFFVRDHRVGTHGRRRSCRLVSLSPSIFLWTQSPTSAINVYQFDPV